MVPAHDGLKVGRGRAIDKCLWGSRSCEGWWIHVEWVDGDSRCWDNGSGRFFSSEVQVSDVDGCSAGVGRLGADGD